MGPTQPPVQ